MPLIAPETTPVTAPVAPLTRPSVAPPRLLRTATPAKLSARETMYDTSPNTVAPDAAVKVASSLCAWRSSQVPNIKPTAVPPIAVAISSIRRARSSGLTGFCGLSADLGFVGASPGMASTDFLLPNIGLGVGSLTGAEVDFAGVGAATTFEDSDELGGALTPTFGRLLTSDVGLVRAIFSSSLFVKALFGPGIDGFSSGISGADRKYVEA